MGFFFHSSNYHAFLYNDSLQNKVLFDSISNLGYVLKFWSSFLYYALTKYWLFIFWITKCLSELQTVNVPDQIAP